MCSLGEAIALENLQKGMAKGVTKGMAKKNLENAISMLREKLPLDVISRVTSLPQEKLQSLAVENGSA